MTIRTQAYFWIGALVLFVLILWGLGGILTPFLAGMAIAYFLDPAADRLEAVGFSRVAATGTIFALALLVTVLAILVLVPLLIEQIRSFAARAPEYADQLRLFASRIAAKIFPDSAMAAGGTLEEILAPLKEKASTLGVDVLRKALSGGAALAGMLAAAVITPVVAFYMLLDWDRMVERIDALLPREHCDTIREIAHGIDDVLAGFVRGQLSVCVILGSFYAIALTLIGLEFGLLIGLFAGLVSFIPFVGSITGFVLSMGVALAQFWGNWPPIIGVAAIFFIGQAVEGNILTPKLVGDHVGLHPVWLMFALSAFGALFGLPGLLIAVPTAAAIGVLARFALRQYQDSKLYSGGPM